MLSRGVSEIPSKPYYEVVCNLLKFASHLSLLLLRRSDKSLDGLKVQAYILLERTRSKIYYADIGSIEKRIDRLEYYLRCNLMEMQSKDKVIMDANGNDRFKNGIYTNPFDSDLLSDIADPSYNAAYQFIQKL